jgi:VanZ family protein
VAGAHPAKITAEIYPEALLRCRAFFMFTPPWNSGSVSPAHWTPKEFIMGRNVKDGVVNDYQLALISKSVFDIGPRTRVVILMFGLIGIAMAFMASLVSHKQVPLDKIIHFSGYFVLSTTFVLALRPVFFIPGLIGLIGMSVGIEFLQRYTGRSFDVTDMVANSIGVASGGMTGMILRGIYGLISKELAARKAHQRLVRFRSDDILIREGDPINDMYIIQSGRVRATRNVGGREISLMTAGAGEVLGVLGVVEGRPQYATLRALEPTVVYRMGMNELMESAGGSELPISLVLSGMSEKIRRLADQLTKSGRGISADSTMA